MSEDLGASKAVFAPKQIHLASKGEGKEPQIDVYRCLPQMLLLYNKLCSSQLTRFIQFNSILFLLFVFILNAQI